MYIDDLLVHGRTKEEHDARLNKVFQRARDKNLKFKWDKCRFGIKEIKYVGHILSSEGVKPDNEKIEAIVHMPTPNCKGDIERFLGMITYIAKFVPNLSEMSAPLRELLKKDTLWFWSKQHDKAFEQLKDLVTKAPMLKFYDVKKPVKVSVDASQKGLGAVVLQDEGPVAYASRALTPTEQNYAQIEKEMLAIVYGLERFHQYVYGRNIVEVETDHKPLEAIVRKPLVNAPPRLQRMLMRLQRYNTNISYKPGKQI